jgi:phage shock protein C
MQVNSNPKRLYRTSDDRIIAGVAGGVAAYFDVDPVIVRIIWFMSVIFTGSLTFWAYIVMIWVVPLEPSEWPAPSPWAPGGGPAGFGTDYVPPSVAAAPPAQGAPANDTPVGGAPTGNAAAGDAATGEPGRTPAPDPGVAGFAATPGAVPGWGSPWATDWRAQRRQDRAARRAEEGGRSKGLILGLFLILIGALLAWHQVDPNFDLNVTWPIVIVAFGAVLILSSFRRTARS